MNTLPRNPEPWPLSRIPQLTEPDFQLVLYSLAQEILSAADPFALYSMGLHVFLQTPWTALGLSSEMLDGLIPRFSRMFGIALKPCRPDETPAAFVSQAFTLWLDSPRVVTFFTSGSTGTPKPCVHPEDHLRQEIIGIAPLMSGCLAARVLVPLHHMYGFTFGLQLPRALGIPIVKTPPLPQVITGQMQPGDLLVGIPHLWKRVVAGVPVDGQGMTLLTATAPTPPEVLAELNQWGFRCREMFGASETGAMCWRETPDRPFTLLPHFTRQSHAGGDVGSVQRLLPDGELRRYPLLDTVEWLDDEHLLPKGRKDSAVQVAGRNVFPAHVAAVLGEHEGVADCIVRMMRSEEGDRLKAFVVPKPHVFVTGLLSELKALCKKRLHSAERPAAYTFGEDLPRTLLGKPGDW